MLACYVSYRQKAPAIKKWKKTKGREREREASKQRGCNSRRKSCNIITKIKLVLSRLLFLSLFEHNLTHLPLLSLPFFLSFFLYLSLSLSLSLSLTHLPSLSLSFFLSPVSPVSNINGVYLRSILPDQNVFLHHEHHFRHQQSQF